VVFGGSNAHVFNPDMVDGKLDLDALGDRMAARKEQLKVKFKAEGLPAPMTRSFTGHKLQQGHTVEAKTA